MTAYEFYWRDEEHGDRLTGILPERRQGRERIAQQSVINRVRTVLGGTVSPDFDKIYLIRVEV